MCCCREPVAAPPSQCLGLAHLPTSTHAPDTRSEIGASVLITQTRGCPLGSVSGLSPVCACSTHLARVLGRLPLPGWPHWTLPSLWQCPSGCLNPQCCACSQQWACVCLHGTDGLGSVALVSCPCGTCSGGWSGGHPMRPTGFSAVSQCVMNAMSRGASACWPGCRRGPAGCLPGRARLCRACFKNLLSPQQWRGT